MRVDPRIEVAGGYAWRLLAIGGVGLAGLWVAARLWTVLLALVVAALLTRTLAGPAAWLGRRLPAGLAAAVALLGFLLVVSAAVTGLSAAIADEAADLEPTLSAAIDDLEVWLVEDSPFDLDRRDVDELRDSVGERVGRALRDSSGAIVAGTIVAAEVLLGLLLGLILTFFALKDGARFVRWVRSEVPVAHQGRVDRMARQAWVTLGGFLRGAALLGVVEGAIVTITLQVVGADLAVPMGVLTLLAAFVPFVGAIVAGILAVLVALATAGTGPAVVVLIVVVVVQQLDNDVLAPVVYGRTLRLHPVVILLSVTAGGALFGIPGSVLAVPVVAVSWNVVAEGRRDADPSADGPDGAGSA